MPKPKRCSDCVSGALAVDGLYCLTFGQFIMFETEAETCEAFDPQPGVESPIDVFVRDRITDLPEATERIKIRTTAGVSQREAAQVLGVALTTFNRWERGLSNPRRGSVARYRKLLDGLARVGR